MEIILDKKVYYRNYFGGIDVILSVDGHNVNVREVETGKERHHSTAIDCNKLSFNPINFYGLNDDCILYIIEAGVRCLENVPLKYEKLINDTSEALKELIELLNKVNNDELNLEVYDGYIQDITEDSIKLKSLATTALITSSGKPNWEHISKVRDADFMVFPGEQDTFGWLTGCIRTNKGILVFG